MPTAACQPDYDALLKLATDFDGSHVPISEILAAGFSRQSLENRIAYLQNAVRGIIESQVKPEMVYRGLKDISGEASALSVVIESACEDAASIRPRARHALEALQNLSGVKVYLSSVISIRDAIRIFDESTKLIANETNTVFNDEYVTSISKQVELLCFVWTNARTKLHSDTKAYRWATERIQGYVLSYRTFLYKAATNALLDISWPCSQAGSTLRLSEEGITNRVKLLLQKLLHMQKSFEPETSPGEYWIISLLAEPIITRFMFHFERDCSTNRPDKPEWFLGFISRSLSQHLPALEILLPNEPNLWIAFTKRLLSPVKAKALSLLQTLASNDDTALFRHCVQHILTFNPPISDMLSQPSMQSKFLSIERDAANAQLDFIFDGLPSPWDPVGSLGQSVVTTNSADLFLSMLFQISEKIIKRLPMLGDRLCFAQLQQSLTSTYIGRSESLLSLRLADINHGGIRTSMVASSNWSAFIGIVNSLDSVRSVLEEWSDHILYLELQYFRDHPNLANRDTLTSADLLSDQNFENAVGASFFSGECKRCNALVGEFIDLLVQVVLKAFRLAASFYINRNNLTHPQEDKPDTEMSLSATLCDGLSVLSSSLNLAASQFGERSFQNFWVAIAKGLDTVLYDGLVRDKYHTAAAVRQLSFDLNAIFTLFRTYTPRPDAAMPMMATALELLQSPIELIQELVDTKSGLPSALAAASVLDICDRILRVASVENSRSSSP